MKHLSKTELLDKARIQARALKAAGKANQIITMVILHEAFDFDADALNDFVERYEDTLEYYNQAKDYQALLNEWNDYFKDYCGVDILSTKETKCGT